MGGVARARLLGVKERLSDGDYAHKLSAATKGHQPLPIQSASAALLQHGLFPVSLVHSYFRGAHSF